MATDTPNSSDSDSGENKKAEETNPARQPRISLRKLSSDNTKWGLKSEPMEEKEEKEEKEKEKENTEPPKPPGRKPRHLGKPPVKAAKDQEKAPVPEETAKKAAPAPARKPRHFRMHPTEEEAKKKTGKKRSAKKKGSRRRALALTAVLAVVSTAFLLPQNPYSPFAENEAAYAGGDQTETAKAVDSSGAEPSAGLPLPGGENKATGPASQPVDAAAQADSGEAVNSVADVLGRLRTVPLHLSTKPEGLFIDRVFYPLDSVIDPDTGLRLISVQPDIRRPVAVFLTPDGEPHSLPLPEKRR